MGPRTFCTEILNEEDSALAQKLVRMQLELKPVQIRVAGHPGCGKRLRLAVHDVYMDCILLLMITAACAVIVDHALLLSFFRKKSFVNAPVLAECWVTTSIRI